MTFKLEKFTKALDEKGNEKPNGFSSRVQIADELARVVDANFAVRDKFTATTTATTATAGTAAASTNTLGILTDPEWRNVMGSTDISFVLNPHELNYMKELFEDAITTEIKRRFTIEIHETKNKNTDAIQFSLSLHDIGMGHRTSTEVSIPRIVGDRHRIGEAPRLIERAGRDATSKIFNDMHMWRDIAEQKMDFKQILLIENIEQRRAALKIYGPEKIIQESKAQLIDKSDRGNELYRIDKVFETTAYFLKYKDPSTDRIYFSGIDPAIFEGKKISKIPQKNKGLADNAMAWKFNMKDKEYEQLKIEG